MNQTCFTIDIDWACEAAIEETLSFFLERNITPTIFTTHDSKIVSSLLTKLDVGLHPFFGRQSSHGATVNEVVKYVLALPHNLKAFRCHRFAVCNESKEAMLKAGMIISSNVCTNLQLIEPFSDRFDFTEYPIFLEDGGYLWHKYPLFVNKALQDKLLLNKLKVILLHPMHFVINSPSFNYMYDIKQSLNRKNWLNMSKKKLDKLKWKGHGMRNFIMELQEFLPHNVSLRQAHENYSARPELNGHTLASGSLE